MSAKKIGLGRGLESLIPTELIDESFDPTADQDERMSDLRQIKIDEISPDPDQPRRHFDELALAELAVSIREHGIIQPIIVAPKDGAYQIVAGERRYRAALQAGLDKVPALVRTLSNQHKLELSLIENLQRRDLNVLETATAYLKLRDQFNLTLEEIGVRVGGRSVSTISNTLRLLRLPEEVRIALAAGTLREGQARPLVNLDVDIIERILPTILKEEWSARKIEQFVVQYKKEGDEAIKETAKSRREGPQPYREEVSKLERKFKIPVAVRTNAKGAGQIIMKFKNDEEFQRINELLKK